MTDEADLVRQIIEFPAEDTFRLQYADWLEENSPHEVPCWHCGGGRPGQWYFTIDPEGRCTNCGRRGADGSGLVSVDWRARRAEFIRLQVRHATLKPRPKLELIGVDGVRLEGKEPLVGHGGFVKPHRATLRFERSRNGLPEPQKVYDLDLKADSGFGLGPTWSHGGTAGFCLTTAYGAVCENLSFAYDGKCYEARFWVTGEKDPVRAERDDLEKRFRSILHNNREAVLPPEYGRPILADKAGEAGILMPWPLLRRGFVRRWIGDWESFVKIADALVWGPEMRSWEFAGRKWVKSEVPCPATAHPVEEVRITDWGTDASQSATFETLGPPPASALWKIRGRTVMVEHSPSGGTGHTWGELVCARWPGVKFVFPSDVDGD